MNAYNPRTWEIEARDSRIQGQLWLFREFKTSVSYMRPYFKEAKPLSFWVKDLQINVVVHFLLFDTILQS